MIHYNTGIRSSRSISGAAPQRFYISYVTDSFSTVSLVLLFISPMESIKDVHVNQEFVEYLPIYLTVEHFICNESW